MADELPNPGLTVTFISRIEDMVSNFMDLRTVLFHGCNINLYAMEQNSFHSQIFVKLPSKITRTIIYAIWISVDFISRELKAHNLIAMNLQWILWSSMENFKSLDF